MLSVGDSIEDGYTLVVYAVGITNVDMATAARRELRFLSISDIALCALPKHI